MDVKHDGTGQSKFLCGSLEMRILTLSLLFEGYGDHRDLHVLTHSFPTRRSADLKLTVRSTGRIIGTVRFGQLEVERGGVIKRSEEHTSELQSLMRTSYAVFCLNKQLSLSLHYRPHLDRDARPQPHHIRRY